MFEDQVQHSGEVSLLDALRRIEAKEDARPVTPAVFAWLVVFLVWPGLRAAAILAKVRAAGHVHEAPMS